MKTKYILSIIAVAAAVVACNEEKPFIDIADAGDAVTLTASIGTPATRIHFNGDKDTYTETRWQEGDCIWVRSDTQPAWERGDCFKTSEAQISADGHSAEFTGRTRAEGRLCAVYPYGMVQPGSDNDEVVLSIPETNELVPGDCPANANAAVAFWADGSTSFSMEYLLGALKVSVTGNGQQIVKASVTDSGKAQLWGTLKVIPDYEDKGIAWTEISNISMARSTATLTTKPIALSSTPLEFYFLLPDGVLKEGFVLRLTDTEDNTYVFATDKDNEIVPGKVVKMPAVDLADALSEADLVLFSGGEGVPLDPYKISTTEDLIQLATFLSDENKYASFAAKFYVQTADLDMEGKAFSPIGSTSAAPFRGTYDGGGFKISNLSVQGASSDNPASGVFGYICEASVKNLTVANRSNTGSFNRVGGVVGYADSSEIDDCHITGGELTASANMLGGIVAEMKGGSVKNCSASEVVLTQSANYAAAIVAYAHDKASIKFCKALGGTKVNCVNHAGAIAGEFNGDTIIACLVEGAKISGKQNIGGLVGWFDAGTMEGCTVSGATEITGSGDGVGGLIGRAISKGGADNWIDGCTVTGGTSVKGTYSLGGLVGYAYPDADGNLYIINSGVVNASIHGTLCDTGGDPAKGDCMNGGILGWARLKDSGSKAWIVNCYSYLDSMTLDLNMSHPSVGGIVGYGSISSTGKLEIVNCVTTFVEGTVTMAGSAFDPSTPQSGSLYGLLPNSAGVRVADNHYLGGGLSEGTAGASCVIDNNVGYIEGVFKDGETVIAKLNEFVLGETTLTLSSWVISNNLPVIE